jgi:hypothetical protein
MNNIATTIARANNTFHIPIPIENESVEFEGRGSGVDSAASTVRTDSQVMTQQQHWSAIERILAILGNLLWASLPAHEHPLLGATFLPHRQLGLLNVIMMYVCTDFQSSL